MRADIHSSKTLAVILVPLPCNGSLSSSRWFPLLVCLLSRVSNSDRGLRESSQFFYNILLVWAVYTIHLDIHALHLGPRFDASRAILPSLVD